MMIEISILKEGMKTYQKGANLFFVFTSIIYGYSTVHRGVYFHGLKGFEDESSAEVPWSDFRLITEVSYAYFSSFRFY
jgi:hypothetical protein